MRKKFRHVYTTCLQYGLDMTQQRLPITPAAHYFMGGIYTDLSGRTSLRGLYAAGEAASTGVHGANRLASNSLLETLVFGGRTAQAMRDDGLHPTPSKARVLSDTAEPLLDNRAYEQIRETTWHYAGVVRNAEGLKAGADLLRTITTGDVTTRNLVTVANMIHEAALARIESRGAHYREDFPSVGQCALHSYIKNGRALRWRYE
jgi:L-aspartate oxidase